MDTIRPIIIFLAAVATTLMCISCATQNPPPSKYKHPEFYSEERVIVQNTDKFFINDIPKGEVKK